MAAPTATQIRDELEGYGITTTVLSDAWIERCRDEEMVPHVESITRQTYSGVAEVTEHYSGNGTSTLFLNRRPVIEVVKIETVGAVVVANLSGATELDGAQGVLKAKTNLSEGIYYPTFPKGDRNIKVTYRYGYDDFPADVSRAVRLLVAAKALALIGARTGGGSLSVQAHGRSYGTHGKYTDIRKEFVNSAYSILRKRMNYVVGA